MNWADFDTEGPHIINGVKTYRAIAELLVFGGGHAQILWRLNGGPHRSLYFAIRAARVGNGQVEVSPNLHFGMRSMSPGDATGLVSLSLDRSVSKHTLVAAIRNNFTRSQEEILEPLAELVYRVREAVMDLREVKQGMSEPTASPADPMDGLRLRMPEGL